MTPLHIVPLKDNMSLMKKHPFMTVDFRSTVKLTLTEERQIKKWLLLASSVTEELFKSKIILDKPKSITVSLMICGDSKIKELNRQYRQKDKVTDVLSFPAHEDLRIYKTEYPDLFLGDLAICHAQTKRQSKEFNISYMDEFIHLFIHGLLHLLGYDHEKSLAEEKLMERLEQKALKKFSAKKRAR